MEWAKLCDAALFRTDSAYSLLIPLFFWKEFL